MTEQNPKKTETEKETNRISIQSVNWSVTLPKELEDQLLLAGAALGCKGKSDLIATAARFFIRATTPLVKEWIERKVLIYKSSPDLVIQEALNLYKSSNSPDSSS